VELVYPRGILGNTMTKPPSLKISADGGAGDSPEDKARADLKRLFGED
jgi:hypothetical protein